MAVYDDQTPEGQEDEELRNELGESYNRPLTGQHRLSRQAKKDGDFADDDESRKRRDIRTDDQAADDRDSDNVNEQIRAGLLNAREQDAAAAGGGNDSGEGDAESGGFFRDTKNKIKATAKTRGGSSSGRNKILIGASIGLTTLGVGLIASFGNFFATFKLEHIIQSIEQNASARFNASLDGRSKSYMKAYFKLRLGEISNADGSYSGDNLFFKANKVETGNPVKDWYRTLRTGSFEKDLLQKEGITFTSVAVKDDKGAITLRSAKLTMKNEGIPLDVINRNDIDTIVKAGAGDLNAVNKLGKDFDSFFEKEVFGSNKQARKAVKKEVNDATHFYNVIKRRHIRKDIQNKTGIGSWKLFEKTRDKISAKKVALQQKILQKVLPNNKVGDFIGCLFGSGPCGNTADPNAPENNLGAKPEPTADASKTPAGNGVDAPTEALGPDGKVVPVTNDKGVVTGGATAAADGAQLASEIGTTIENAATTDVTDQVAQQIEQEGLSLAEQEAVSSSVPGPQAIWNTAKKIQRLRNLIRDGVLSKFVKNWRVTQDIAMAGTTLIALSQAKSGQLTAEEFGNFMKAFDDVGKSEGWNKLTDPTAQLGTEADKAEYAKKPDNSTDPGVPTKAKAPIQYFTDSPKDSKAAALEDSFKHSFVFTIINPIADFVDGIKNNTVTNFIANAVDLVGNLGQKIFERIGGNAAIDAILQATGLKGQIGKLMNLAVTKILTFLGATARFSGGALSTVNYLMSGLSGQAETSTRTSGGVAATTTTTAYTNNLAANYLKDQRASQSFYDKFASLNNANSLFSTTLFSATSSGFSGSLMKAFSSLASLPSIMGSLFTGHSYAAATDNFSIADWAGIDKYDIPQQCQEPSDTNPGGLDPLDGDYTAKAVGVVGDAAQHDAAQKVVDSIRGQLTIDVERDSAKFWKLVHDKIASDSDMKQNEQAITESIYNCALLDERVQSGLGYTSGYSTDGGLNDGGSSASATTTPATTPTGAADPAGSLNGYTIPCTGQPAPVKRLAGPRADWSGVADSGSIGTNSDGKPIKVYIRAACDPSSFKTIVIIGGIHGTENGGGLVAWDMLFNAKLPDNVRIVAVPELNGYGIDNSRRVNKNGVDLNRNEAFNWGQGGSPNDCSESSPSCNHYQGPSVSSEPETKAIDTFLLSLGKVDLFTVYHDNLNYVAPVGNTPVGIGNTYATLVDMKGQGPHSIGDTITVSQHGSLDGWFNQKTGTPSLLIELGNDQSPTIIDKHVNAIQQLLVGGSI